MFRTLWLWWKQRSFHNLQKKSVEEIFSGVYEKNEWGGSPGTFYSGDGTHHPDTARYIAKVRAFIQDNKVESILEIGCGDFHIASQIVNGLPVRYQGTDVVSSMIEHHQQRHQTDTIRFQKLNAIEDPLPPADLVIIRQVLQHLGNAQIQQILNKLGPYKYALITEHLPSSANPQYNLDKIPGPHIRMKFNSGVFIDQPPFNVKNTSVLLEYASNDRIKGREVPAVLRTSLIAHPG